MSTDTTATAPVLTEGKKQPIILADDAVIVICGFDRCRNHIRARDTYRKLQKEKETGVKAILWESDRDTFHIQRVKFLQELHMESDQHKTSPLIFVVDKDNLKPMQYIGGGSDFVEIVQRQFDVEPVPLGPILD
jgi:hypothetical protein